MFARLVGPDAPQGVGAAFTDRHGGVTPGTLGPLNLGRTDVEEPSRLAENFDRLRAAVGVPHLVTLHQVHGDRVVRIDEQLLAAHPPQAHLGGADDLPHADAMVTDLAGVALVIRVADCLPVVFASESGTVIGAAHAGREGLRRGVLSRTVEQLAALGATGVRAWIGPHVCAACYEVDAELAAQVAAEHPEMTATSRWGTPALDLGRAAERELRAQGVEVERLDPCTLTTPDLHSHRRDGAGAGRGAGVIWRVSGPA